MVDLHPGRLRCRTVIYLLLGFSMVATILFLFSWTRENSARVERRPRRRRRDYIDVTQVDHKRQTQFLERTTNENLTLYSLGTKGRRKGYCRIYKRASDPEKYCVPFKTYRGETPICIFDPKEDRMISSYVKDYGTWEPDLLNLTADIINEHPKLQFIDLGCNLGVFTIYIAKLGRRVVSIDILSRALDNLQQSLKLGNLTENVTLILNAMSNTREKVKVNIVSDNIGGSHVREHGEKGVETDEIQSIVMDDLLEVISSGEVFIKMDIEGHEQKALENSKEFFQKVNVKFILMEWMLHKGKKSGDKIIQYLLGNGLLPYLDYNKREVLELGRSSFWPDNVIWAKR